MNLNSPPLVCVPRILPRQAPISEKNSPRTESKGSNGIQDIEKFEDIEEFEDIEWTAPIAVRRAVFPAKAGIQKHASPTAQTPRPEGNPSRHQEEGKLTN